MDDVGTLAERLRAGRTPFVHATVVRARRPASARPGDRALVLADGTVDGFVGGACAESTVRLQGLRLLGTGGSTLLRITPDPSGEVADADEGLVTVGNPCLSGGTLEIFLEAMLPPPLVHVFGEAPVARALVTVGEALGYAVRLTADPAAAVAPDSVAVVVASHGRDEEAVLRAALAAGVRYVGLVASPRRGAAVVGSLDVDEADRARIRTPAGLDIRSRTAPEVALSILAEVVASRPADPHPPQPVAGSAPAAAAQILDPVCGMTVAASTAGPHVEYAGTTWYFCGPGCRQAFADDPSRYAAGAAG